MLNPLDRLEVLSKYFDIERGRGQRKLWCKVCDRGWAIPNKKVETFNPLSLLHHARTHEDARKASGGDDLMGRGRIQRRARERVFWLLAKMNYRFQHGFIVAWDTDFVDEFVERFPEAERTLKVFMVGPNVSPMLSRTARMAYDLGYVTKGYVGNMDARNLVRKTWCRTWTITQKGIAALAQRAASGD